MHDKINQICACHESYHSPFQKYKNVYVNIQVILSWCLPSMPSLRTFLVPTFLTHNNFGADFLPFTHDTINAHPPNTLPSLITDCVHLNTLQYVWLSVPTHPPWSPLDTRCNCQRMILLPIVWWTAEFSPSYYFSWHCTVRNACGRHYHWQTYMGLKGRGSMLWFMPYMFRNIIHISLKSKWRQFQTFKNIHLKIDKIQI